MRSSPPGISLMFKEQEHKKHKRHKNKFPAPILVPLVLLVFLFPLLAQNRLDTREPITYFIDDGKAVPGYRSSDRELAVMALNAWSRESQGKLMFSEAKSRDLALIRFHWIDPNEGLFGETQRIAVKGKVGA